MAKALGAAAEFQSVWSRRDAASRASCGGSDLANRLPDGDWTRGLAAQILYPGYVSVPQRSRPPRGASGRLYRDRYSGPLQTGAWIQRAAPDGVGRLWVARRTIRDPDWSAPAENNRGQYRHVQTPNPIPWF